MSSGNLPVPVRSVLTEKIILSGNVTKEPEIYTALKKAFKTEVQVWNPLNALLDEPLAKDSGCQFIASLGASLEEM